MNPLTAETENRALIVRGRYDLTVPERALIERGLLLADSLGKKEYICPILKARFVFIPAGTFMMGSPEDEPGRKDNETLHQVTISKPFYLQTTQVTQGQWKKVMGNNQSHFKGDDNLPVQEVSWNDVQEFIRKLNKTEGTDKYRLPTEAQWEYACRAGSTTAYCFGDDPGRLGEYAWIDDSSAHPVGQKKPNAWGLYDMHGNVRELVQDEGTYYPAGHVTDPEGPSSGLRRVLRGGRSIFGAMSYRSAKRGSLEPGKSLFGFRLISLSNPREIPSESAINKKITQEDSWSEGLKELIRLGKEKGFLTYDDVNDLLPSDVISSDQIDDIIKLFGEKNIDIIDTDKGERLVSKQLAKSKEPVVAKGRATSRDGDFIAYNNGTVLDTRTNLMWAEEDNEFGINWANAKSYCKNYRRGGYTDWRMPTLDELEGLYESGNYENGDKSGNVIQITGWFVWASETRGSEAAYFDFNFGLGGRNWVHQSYAGDGNYRALPVRSGK